MGMFYKASEWIMRLMILNILWIIFNLPIIYITINLIVVEGVNEFIFGVITLILLSPFLLFPATFAMFAVARKWVMKEVDVPILRCFWNYYKQYYITSMLRGLILIVIWFVLSLDYYFIVYKNESLNSALLFYLSLTFIILFMFLIIFTLNFISYSVHLKATILESLKETLIITIGKPFIGLSVFALSFVVLYISINVITFFIPFFMCSLIAIISFSGFNLIYLEVLSLRNKE